MRECVNCKYSKGIGSDVWCGHDPKGKESYMFETDCPYFRWWSEKRFEILELIDENDGEISYLVSDGKILIEVHDKKECAIKLKEILDNEW